MVFSSLAYAYQPPSPMGLKEEESIKSFRGDEAEQGLQDGQAMSDNEVISRGKALSEGVLAGVTYQVHIVGEVKQPGTYRLSASDRLQEALQRAGGILEQGSLRGVQIRRQGDVSKTYDLLRFQISGDLQQNPYLLDNDVIHVPLRNQAIQMVGSVKRPQIYELHGEKTLADVIKLAGGLTVGAEMSEPIRLIRYDNGAKEILEIDNAPAALRATAVRNGDVVFVANVLSADHSYDYNIGKIPGDKVFYPSYEDRVFVLGGVNQPGPYPFNPHHTVNHYLTLAGGTKSLAKIRRMKLLSISGKSQRIGGKKIDVIKINPGDTIYVPEARVAPETWAQILVGIASAGAATTAAIIGLTR